MLRQGNRTSRRLEEVLNGVQDAQLFQDAQLVVHEIGFNPLVVEKLVEPGIGDVAVQMNHQKAVEYPFHLPT